MTNHKLSIPQAKTQQVYFALTAIAILVIGGLFYVSFRQEAVLTYRWIVALGLDLLIRQVTPSSLTLPDVIMGSLPTFLLTLSLLLMGQAIGLISQISGPARWGISFAIALGFTIAFELFQLLGLITGAADLNDVLAACLAVPVFMLPTLWSLSNVASSPIGHQASNRVGLIANHYCAKVSILWASYLGIALLS